MEEREGEGVLSKMEEKRNKKLVRYYDRGLLAFRDVSRNEIFFAYENTYSRYMKWKILVMQFSASPSFPRKLETYVNFSNFPFIRVYLVSFQGQGIFVPSERTSTVGVPATKFTKLSRFQNG